MIHIKHYRWNCRFRWMCDNLSLKHNKTLKHQKNVVCLCIQCTTHNVNYCKWFRWIRNIFIRSVFVILILKIISESLFNISFFQFINSFCRHFLCKLIIILVWCVCNVVACWKIYKSNLLRNDWCVSLIFYWKINNNNEWFFKSRKNSHNETKL